MSQLLLSPITVFIHNKLEKLNPISIDRERRGENKPRVLENGTDIFLSHRNFVSGSRSKKPEKQQIELHKRYLFS